MARRPRSPEVGTRVPESKSKGKWRRGLGNRTPGVLDAAAVAVRKQRRMDAFNLRVSGVSTNEIGRRLGISGQQASRDIDRAIKELGHEGAEKKRAVYTAKLERALLDETMAVQALKSMATAEPPDLDASRTMAAHNRTIGRLIAELAHINDIYAPEKVEHTGKGGGPLAISLDDLLGTMRQNEAGVDAERGDGHTTH